MKRLAVLLVIAALSACGGSSPPSVDAARVLRDGGAAMARLSTVSATLKLTKGTISLLGFTLVSAKTAVRLTMRDRRRISRFTRSGGSTMARKS